MLFNGFKYRYNQFILEEQRDDLEHVREDQQKYLIANYLWSMIYYSKECLREVWFIIKLWA